MIGEVSIKPNAQATAEESDRILRRYSNEKLMAAALELVDALEQARAGAMPRIVIYDGDKLEAAESRLRGLLGLKPVSR